MIFIKDKNTANIVWRKLRNKSGKQFKVNWYENNSKSRINVLKNAENCVFIYKAIIVDNKHVLK